MAIDVSAFSYRVAATLLATVTIWISKKDYYVYVEYSTLELNSIPGIHKNMVAVAASFKPTVQAKCEIKSPIKTVKATITATDTTNAGYPFANPERIEVSFNKSLNHSMVIIPAGGINAKIIFQKIVK